MCVYARGTVFFSRPCHLPVPAGQAGLLGAAARLHRSRRILSRVGGLGSPCGLHVQWAEGGLRDGQPRVRMNGPLLKRLFVAFLNYVAFVGFLLEQIVNDKHYTALHTMTTGT